MKHGLLVSFIAIFISTQALAVSQDVLEETYYQNFKDSIYSKSKKKQMIGFSKFEQSLYVDALWDALDEAPTTEALKTLNQVQTIHFDLVDKLRVSILRIRYGRESTIPEVLKADVINSLRSLNADLKLIYIVAAYEKELSQAGDLAKIYPEYYHIIPDKDKVNTVTDEMIADLFYKTPDVTTYMNGEYSRSIKLLVFCRTNRLHQCLMIMKDIYGNPVRNEDGTLWTHKALASSKQGLPSYVRNGNTPAGILTIDSVMPTADQQISFGKFRRLILNFIPKSKDEVLLKSLLPESSKSDYWWTSGTTARDIGRNLLRIHGTGKINPDPTVPYYPFMRTSGCIAQRENTYEGVTFIDQRNLLDQMMEAMSLEPIYANETAIKGILYLVELDDKDASVEIEDLIQRGIE
jgi:hypothetical protein